MGEGWSDWFSLVLRMSGKETPATDMGVGIYVYSKTIRKYMYSTSMTTNPTTYETLNEPAFGGVHAIGEVWANMLYQVYHNLVEATGKFNKNIYQADDYKSGNTLALWSVVNGMKLQPCNPTFLNARDAILQAEAKATGGAFKCAIWKGFAKRGLGPNAKNTPKRVNDFTVPADCPKDETTPEVPKPEEPKPEEPKPEVPKPEEPKQPEIPKPEEPKQPEQPSKFNPSG